MIKFERVEQADTATLLRSIAEYRHATRMLAQNDGRQARMLSRKLNNAIEAMQQELARRGLSITHLTYGADTQAHTIGRRVQPAPGKAQP